MFSFYFRIKIFLFLKLLMQISSANIAHLFKNDEMVCLPFEKNQLLNNRGTNDQLKVKGANNKKVLVWVSHSIDDLNSADNILLFNILKAIHLTIDDIKLVEYTGMAFKIMTKLFEVEKCILIGLSPRQVGLQVANVPYTVFNLNDTPILLSDSTHLLNKHKKHKESLWIALQKMFGLK